MIRAILSLLILLTFSGCIQRDDDGAVDVAIIGDDEALFAGGLRLSYGAQKVRAATAQGLVTRAVGGEIVPAIAERWIVTDDGASYIFRIREFDLPDGSRLTAQTVRDSLQRSFSRLGGTSMGYDLAKVRDVRAMTGRVVEIRLKSPMPDFLQLLAQPELGLQISSANIGPMMLTRDGQVAVLSAMRPEERGLPQQPDWDEDLLDVRVTATDAQNASAGFGNGEYDLVLGGRVQDLPYADTGALSRGTVRLESTVGIFGLDILNSDGLLAQAEHREALSMALDREALIQPFNIGGWITTTRLVFPGLTGDTELLMERWQTLDLEERQGIARGRIAEWRAQSGEEPSLRIYLPSGPGSDTLFDQLSGQYETVGVELIRAETRELADLALRDRVARYGGARWFLNQFNCDVSPAICSPDVDFLVQLAVDTTDPAEAASYLFEAETALAAFNPHIPFGAPIRWSLVRGDIDAFAENPWNVHPLFPLSRAPI